MRKSHPWVYEYEGSKNTKDPHVDGLLDFYLNWSQFIATNDNMCSINLDKGSATHKNDVTKFLYGYIGGCVYIRS